MPRSHILFDLDGTLVDSFAGIAASLRHALAGCGLDPDVPLGRELVGPPLKELLAPWVPAGDAAMLDRAVQAFKAHYDVHGCRLAEPFEGVGDLLEALSERGTRATIVTNKRSVPARAIVESLGWSRYLQGLHALDTVVPPAASKAEVLAGVMAHYGLAGEETCYVGDREDDAEAASAVGIPFALARWGYGKSLTPPPGAGWFSLEVPEEVLAL